MTGINVIGMPNGLHGLGMEMRDKVKAMRSAGIDVCIVARNYSSLQSSINDPEIDALIAEEPRFDVNLICHNLPATFLIARDFPELLEGRYNIGAPYWEFPELPPSHQAGLDTLDELWVSNGFLQDIFRPYTSAPIHQMPLHLEAPLLPDEPPRPHEKPLTFGYLFDCNSLVKRKDPAALITAFLQAFGHDPEANVKLVLKYKYEPAPYVNPVDIDHFIKLIWTDNRIHLIDHELSALEMHELVRSFDVFVSPHRAEGLGRGIVEAMLLGKAIAATDYSGPSEFLHGGHAVPLAWDATKVGDAAVGDIKPDFSWVDVEMNDLIAALKMFAEDPTLVEKRGAAGRDFIRGKTGAILHGNACLKRLQQLAS